MQAVMTQRHTENSTLSSLTSCTQRCTFSITHSTLYSSHYIITHFIHTLIHYFAVISNCEGPMYAYLFKGAHPSELTEASLSLSSKSKSSSSSDIMFSNNCWTSAPFKTLFQLILGLFRNEYAIIAISTSTPMQPHEHQETLLLVGTCEASRFDSTSNRTSDSGFDS